MLHNDSKTQHHGQVCLCMLQDGKDLVFGANVSQSRAIEELQKPSQPQPFRRMADHLLRIAGKQSSTSQGVNTWIHICNELFKQVIIQETPSISASSGLCTRLAHAFSLAYA